MTTSVVGVDEVVLVLILVEEDELDGGVVVLKEDLPISCHQNLREWTHDEDGDGVSFVVVTELDSMNAVVEDDKVRVVAELKANISSWGK